MCSNDQGKVEKGQTMVEKGWTMVEKGWTIGWSVEIFFDRTEQGN